MFRNIVLTIVTASVVSIAAIGHKVPTASAGAIKDLDWRKGSGSGRGWRPSSVYSHCYVWFKHYKLTGKAGYLFKYQRCLRRM